MSTRNLQQVALGVEELERVLVQHDDSAIGKMSRRKEEVLRHELFAFIIS